MITILGTQITIFMLYALVSLQLLAIGLPIIGYRMRNVLADGFPLVTVLLCVFGAFLEIALLISMGSL